jgi:hypothetical protein
MAMTKKSKPKEISLSTDDFRKQLKSELTKICEDLGKKYDNNQHRGYAFEIWSADLLLKLSEIEGDGADYVYASNDLKVDIAFEDEESKTLCLSQAKCESIPSNPPIEEDHVASFFKRHQIFLEESEWVREHSSDQLHDLVCDYSKRVEEGWNIDFYFVSTGSASDRLKKLVASLDQSVKIKFPSVNFILLDFYDLKERYIRSRSIDAPISEFVDIQFPQEYFIIKNTPHRTILSVIKGNALVNLYKREKESLFAHNVRSFLGKRINKEVVETAANNPDDFYYFNNGVSAICTKIEQRANNTYRFHHFQVINGAQTIGSLRAAGDLDPACEVILRITEGASVKTEKGFNADIIRYNNTQNVVRASDFRANDKIQLWLEQAFNQLKARGAIKFPFRYVRKRSFHRVREAHPIKLEELAKIRYSYLYEPTRCIADPRSLWTTTEDGGFYEHAFGVSGELEDAWSDAVFDETLFATVVFVEIMDRIKKLIKQDRSKYFFLQRLRYWALALSALHVRLKRINHHDLLESRSNFEKWFDEFWRDIFRELVSAHSRAQEDKISNFALTRSETRWDRVKQQLDLVLGANIT